MNTTPTAPRQRRRITSILMVVLPVVLLVTVLSVPVSREWVFFALNGGKWITPKGYPFAEAWRDWDKPTDPRELAAYEYAHSLKLPDSLPKPVPFDFNKHLFSARRTTAVAYFDHLCATEAGEYIFKTVDKVEGLYQMRAMPKRTEQLLRDRYGFEDPADWSQGESHNSQTVFIGWPGSGFRYFESYRSPTEIAERGYSEHWKVMPGANPDSAPYWYYYDPDENTRGGEVIPVAELKSRYAYTWRGIRRPYDREYGVAGGELIVLDRITGEILGVRRSFAIARQSPRRLDWEFAYPCPDTLRDDGKKRISKAQANYPFSFVFQVLRPIDLDPSRMRFN